jgi:hypothetical protein
LKLPVNIPQTGNTTAKNKPIPQPGNGGMSGLSSGPCHMSGLPGDIILTEEALMAFKVVGVFEKVLE